MFGNFDPAARSEVVVKSRYIRGPVSDRLRKVTSVDEIEVILKVWGNESEVMMQP